MFPCLGTRFNPRAVGLEANRFVCIFRKERQTTESISWQIISRIANKICRSIVKSSIGTCNCLSTGALVAIFAASPHLKVLFFFYRILPYSSFIALFSCYKLEQTQTRTIDELKKKENINNLLHLHVFHRFISHPFGK